MSRYLATAALVAAGLGAGASSVLASDLASLPVTFGGELNTKFQGEMTSVDNGGGHHGTLFNDSDLSAFVNWGEWFSIDTNLKIERNRNSNIDSYYPSSNSTFRSEGLTLRQLYGTIRPIENVAVYGGKIHPKFGSAWENTPGMFYNFASDYEQDERIGAGIAVTLPEVLGNVQLSAETFFLDTSVLSNSLFSRPSMSDDARTRRYTRAAGGASNTGSLDSYTFALRGEKPPVLEGLKYQVSYTRQDVSLEGEKAEEGFSVGAGYQFAVNEDLSITPFVEYATFDNLGGTANYDASYWVGGVATAYGPWTLSVSGGVKDTNDKDNETKFFDTQKNLTLSYTILEGLEAGAGVNHVRRESVSSVTWGPYIAYNLKF